MKIIKIDDCASCPFLYLDEGENYDSDILYPVDDKSWRCGKTARWLADSLDEVPTVIPEWCPLEDE